MNEPWLKEINREWSKASTRRMTYQKIRLYHDGFVRGFQEVFGYTQHFTLSRVKDGVTFFYTSTQEMEGQSAYIFKKFIDAKFINSVLSNLGQRIGQSFEDYVKFAKSLPQDWSSYSNSDLVKTVHHIYDEDRKVELYYWILFDGIEKVLDSAIRQVMTDNAYNNEVIENLIFTCSQPLLVTPLDMERLSILKVALCEGNQRENLLNEHCQEFSFLPMYDIDYEPFSLDYFKKELDQIGEKMTVNEIKREIENIISKYASRRKQYLDLVDFFSGNSTILVMAKFLSDFASFKDRKPYVRDQSNRYTRNLFLEISKRLNLSLSEVLFLTRFELDSALAEEIDAKSIQVAKRIKDSAFLSKDDEVCIFTDTHELSIIDDLIEEKEVTELKGLAVFKGKARGKVSIIISNADFDKFQDGQILVTSSTRPDFVPLMKKAAAILTDEGGLLSHAAIVSRELGVPCIVGLKKATQVLKDNDVVEVDADNGIIKKIN